MDDEWFAYAPKDTAPVFARQSSDTFRSGVMWFAGILVWAAASFWPLRRRKARTWDSGTP